MSEVKHIALSEDSIENQTAISLAFLNDKSKLQIFSDYEFRDFGDRKILYPNLAYRIKPYSLDDLINNINQLFFDRYDFNENSYRAVISEVGKYKNGLGDK